MLPPTRQGSDSNLRLPDSNVRLIFNCPSCGKNLTADLSQADVTGPCPQCGQPVTAPQPRFPANFALHSPQPLTAAANEPKTTEQRVRRSRINADSALDHGHNDQRELAKTLWIITVFILVFCAVVAATWLMQKWIGS